MKVIASVVSALALVGCAGHSPSTPRMMCNVSTVDGGDPLSVFSSSHPLGIGYQDIETPMMGHVAFLTFDDGPSDWTNDFLDILKAKGAHATFFITSKQLKGPKGLDGSYVDEYGHTNVYRDLIKRELDEGHAIGNHTVDHLDIGTLSSDKIESELADNEQLINAGLIKSGGTPHLLGLFRPPFGSPWFGLSSNATVGTDAATSESIAGPVVANHGINVMWTVESSDSHEWVIDESFSRTQLPKANSIVSTPTYADKVTRLKNSVLTAPDVLAGKGVIILMHDTHNTTRDALSDIIDGLIANGYTFQTIEEYVQMRWGRPSIELTPGPNLYSQTVDPHNWGCQQFSTHEVCGRMWHAYQSVCGTSQLLNPVENQIQSSTTNIVSQQFNKGRLELHPENTIPDNVEVK